MVRLRTLFLALAFCLVLPTTVQADDFPLRPYYPEVPFISTDDLLERYDTALIVDIRSKFEYEVAHINKAILLPLTDSQFAEKLEEVRPKDGENPLVFYCNGHTCAKSYQAAQLAVSQGFSSVYAYDGGIFDWISAAPDKATLMGETPARAGRVINSDEFRGRQVSFDRFAAMAKQPNTIVIDIRDPFQREVMPRLDAVRNIPLDPLLNLVVSRIWTEKQLLFFDAVGKQVRWLQYFLESYGYFDYAFLLGGVRSLADDPTKIKPVIEADRSITSDQAMWRKLTEDSRLDNTDRKVLSYLLANVKFNNYVVIDLGRIDKALGMKPHLVQNSAKKLNRLGYILQQVMSGTLIVQVDPRLGWKGSTSGKTWQTTLDNFKEAIKR